MYWEKLTKCKTYADVQEVTHDAVLTPLPVSLPEITFITHKRTVDSAALQLLPDEVKSLGLLPTTIYGDGNCLPRCDSLLVYGQEEKHIDIRGRIIHELVSNEANYLDEKYLKEGSDSSLGRMNFAKTFAMISEHFSGEKLTYIAIQRIFQAEVLSLCRSGSFMGVWQMAALSNILKTDLVSVYPEYAGKTMRKDLNRTFVPFHKVEQNTKSTSCGVIFRETKHLRKNGE